MSIGPAVIWLVVGLAVCAGEIVMPGVKD